MGLDKNQYKAIESTVLKDNRKALISYSLFAMIFFGYSVIMSFFSEAYLKCQSVYISTVICCFIILLYTFFLGEIYPKTIYISSFLLKATLLISGIGIAICQPTDRTVTMIAVSLIIPTSVIENTSINVLLIVITLISYLISANNIIEPAIYNWGTTNLIIFSLAGISTGHAINKSRIQRYVYAESSKELAEVQRKYAYYDQLTGLKNRRAYEEELNNITTTQPEKYCFIMIDINGLKQTNDTYGHKVGDNLIIGTAKCILDAFENTETIYRIGGDEFFIISYEDEEKVLNYIKNLKLTTANYEDEDIHGISVSYGIASNNDISDVMEIHNLADYKMYEYKREYYRRNK